MLTQALWLAEVPTSDADSLSSRQGKARAGAQGGLLCRQCVRTKCWLSHTFTSVSL